MRLQNQVAIITGGANGIGLAACERFAKEGAKIVMADFDDKAGIEQQKILQDKGYDITFIQVNVADRESVDNLVSKTVETYGGVNILVNNAGITRGMRCWLK
jgi:3-oxoacyl-[acyl-carrier protein] reductase